MEMNLSTILTVEEFITNSVCEIEMKRKRGPEKFFLPQNRVWVVPGYQREIRWKAINVETLFENIYNSEKFLGTILISKTSDTRFEIIDGQQRITVLLLFINALEKTGNVRSIDLCEYYNETLESFDKMLEYGFDEKRMRENGILEECTEKDILDQCDALKEIWDTLVRCVNDVVPRRRTSLLDKVLKSSFNVILSNESGGTTSNSICVDYYLDLNAKAVKLDSIDILKAELFRKNYQLMTEKWKNVQRAIKRWNLNETNYPNNTFYFHFFACVINKYLGYELTKLTPELKVTKNIESDNEDIKIGTHIIEAIDDAHFCEIAMEEIEACVKCFEAISDSHGMIYPEFLTYFGGKNSAVANSAYYILNTILKMDNEVPKILATKYFLEVMNKEVSEEKDYKIIYYIYVLAILFVTTQGKKASPQLVRIVLSKDWMKELRDLATQKYNEDIHKIIYDKPTKFNKTVTKRSGQFLPKHIFAVRQYILPTADKRELYVPNEGRLKEYLEDRKISAEHFFVNQSENYEFHYGEGEIATIKCPAKVKKFISYPINYLYLDKHENSALGDGTIVEKIEELDKKEKTIFANELVYQYYKIAKEIFTNGKWNSLLGIITRSENDKINRETVIQYCNVIQGESHAQVFLDREKFDAMVRNVKSERLTIEPAILDLVDPVKPRRDVRDYLRVILERLEKVQEDELAKADSIMATIKENFGTTDVDDEDIEDMVEKIVEFYRTAEDGKLPGKYDQELFDEVKKYSTSTSKAIKEIVVAQKTSNALDCIMAFSQDPIRKVEKLDQLLKKVTADIVKIQAELEVRKAKLGGGSNPSGSENVFENEKTIISECSAILESLEGAVC